MNSFALLQDDVEDASDLAPAPKPAPAPAEPAPPAVQAPPAQERSFERSFDRGPGYAERGRGGWRDGEYAPRGGGGRRGMRGGRGRGMRGRGMRGRGRGFAGPGGYGGQGGYGVGSWDSRVSAGDAPPRGGYAPADAAPGADGPAAREERAEEQAEERATVDAAAREGGEEEKAGGPAAAPPREKEMTLDEYMAKKAALQLGMRSLSTKATRKANNGETGFGGMAVLKKKVDKPESADETSIMSAVTIKQTQEGRAVKDSTHAAVADNAKNQEFFKTPARNAPRPVYHGRDFRANNGDFRRGGGPDRPHFRGSGRGGRFDGGENRFRGGYNRENDGYGRGGDTAYGRGSDNGYGNRGGNDGYGRGGAENYNRQRSGAPNVDDQSAFPSLA